MLRMRLSRQGKKRQPTYRVVVTEIENKRDGRFVEQIGHYDPRANPPAFDIREDRALYWVSVGAQPSDAVRRLLVKQGTYDRLARLRTGEALEALVAEYKGVPLPVAGISAESTPDVTPTPDVPSSEPVEELPVAATE